MCACAAVAPSRSEPLILTCGVTSPSCRPIPITPTRVKLRSSIQNGPYTCKLLRVCVKVCSEYSVTIQQIPGWFPCVRQPRSILFSNAGKLNGVYMCARGSVCAEHRQLLFVLLLSFRNRNVMRMIVMQVFFTCGWLYVVSVFLILLRVGDCGSVREFFCLRLKIKSSMEIHYYLTYIKIE